MIVDMTLQHAAMVCAAARDSDVAAASPLRFAPSMDDLAVYRYQVDGIKRSLLDAHGAPVAIGGFALSAPLTWTAWMVAVPGWERHAIPLYRFAKRTMFALLESGSAERVQAWVLASDRVALQFAYRLGFGFEALVRKMASGVDYVQVRRFR